MSLKCLWCGHIFEEGEERVVKDKNWKIVDIQKVCPICGNAFEETTQCKICGGEFLEDEMINGVCLDCIEDQKGNWSLCYYMAKDNGETEDVQINAFLATQFTSAEIDEILYREMDFLAKYKTFDCSEFINADVDWFAENLSMEV